MALVKSMSKKTITKNFSFVISIVIFSLLANACFSVSSQDEKKLNNSSKENSKNYSAPQIVGKIESETGECFLYIGDFGNNARTRSEHTIYKVKEPTAFSKDSSKKNPQITGDAEAIKFSYPDIRHDAETLLVHPQTKDIYVITKRLTGAAGVYKLKANYDKSAVNKLEKISDFSVPAVPEGFLTGGDISPDGKRVVICDYFFAYEISLPDNAKSFDEIWKEKPLKIELGTREQGEAIAYAADGNSIFATSENKNSPFIEVKRK